MTACNLLTSKKGVLALLAMVMVFTLALVIVVSMDLEFAEAKEVLLYAGGAIAGIASAHSIGQGIADHGKTTDTAVGP